MGEWASAILASVDADASDEWEVKLRAEESFNLILHRMVQVGAELQELVLDSTPLNAELAFTEVACVTSGSVVY